MVGMSPAAILTRQYKTVCAELGPKRSQESDAVRKQLERKDVQQRLRTFWEEADKNGNDLVDRGEFRDALLACSKELFSRDISIAEANLLTCFVQSSDAGGSVAESQICLIFCMWDILNSKQEEWGGMLNAIDGPITVDELFTVLKTINSDGAAKVSSKTSLDKTVKDGSNHSANTGKVSLYESEWVLEMSETFPNSNDPGIARLALLLSMAFWYISPQKPAESGLLKQKLIDRLDIESEFRSGLMRLLNLMIMFIFLTQALSIAGRANECRSIRETLHHMYDIGSMEDMATVEDVRDYMKYFSTVSGSLTPMSNEYFRNGAEYKMLAGQKTFAEPLMMPDMNLFIGESFSLLVWVKLGEFAPVGDGLPLFRRALTDDLSCWSWSFPPALSFGAHDYGGASANPATGRAEERVEPDPPYPPPFQSERSMMRLHTLVVNQTHANFIVDGGTLLGAVPLPRPVTDCAFPSSLSVGSDGLTLASLRFFPRTLSLRDIGEIYAGGATMTDVGYVVPVQNQDSLNDVQAIRRVLGGIADAGERRGLNAVQSRKSASVLTAVASRDPIEIPTPYINGSHAAPLMLDPVLGMSNYEVYSDPIYTNRESENAIDGNSIPEFSTGFAVSAWVKFDQSTGSGFLMTRSVPQINAEGEMYWAGYGSMCWFIYMGGGITELRTRSTEPDQAWGPRLEINDNALPDGWKFKGEAYRHFVFQVDATDAARPLMLCIDGVCDSEYHSLSGLENGLPADCGSSSMVASYNVTDEERAQVENSTMIFLNRRPPHDWPMIGHQMNVRYFNHTLSEDEIGRIFREDPDPEDAKGRSVREVRGCRYITELVDDSLFVDDFGNDCFWYFNARVSGSSVCQRSRSARSACPVACQVEACFGAASGSQVAPMQIWDRQMEFQSNGSSGTMCVAASTTPEAEAIRCGKNAPDFPEQCEAMGIPSAACGPKDCEEYAGDRDALVSCLGELAWISSETQRTDMFVPCADIITHSDPSCTWDDSDLDAVGDAIDESGSWSIKFWVETMSGGDCMVPQLRLIDGEGLAFARLGGWQDLEWDPPRGTGCNSEGWFSLGFTKSLEGGYAPLPEADTQPSWPKLGEKQFMVIGRRDDGFAGMQYNVLGNFDNANQEGFRPSIKGGRDFLKVINVMGNVRMSPWILSSDFPVPGDLAALRYEQLDLQTQKTGTPFTLSEQVSRRQDRVTNTFTHKTMLVAPPLIFQTRRSEGPCSSDFSDSVVTEYARIGGDTQCSLPYVCPGFTAGSIYRCSGKDMQSGMFFGLEPRLFAGSEYYVEYLSTIADNENLVRPLFPRDHVPQEHELMPTSNFLDTLTSKVHLSAVYYSVQFGITTYVNITFNTDGAKVTSSSTFQHYIALVDDLLDEYITVQRFGFVSLALLILDNALCIRGARIKRQQVGHYDWAFISVISLDVFVSSGMLVFLILVLVNKDNSGPLTSEIIGELVSLEWSGQVQNYYEKTSSFLEIVDRISNEINWSITIESFGMAMAIVMLLRMVLATKAHPRIALITSTLSFAMADLFHFSLIFSIVFFGLAMIASWRFAAEREDLGSFGAAVTTQFDAMLGAPGAFGLSNQEDVFFMVYALLFHLIVFFFMLNFILAIIVDSYAKVCEELEKCTVEMDLASDTLAVLKYEFNAIRHKWPARHQINYHLRGMRFSDMKFINAEDLTLPTAEALERQPSSIPDKINEEKAAHRRASLMSGKVSSDSTGLFATEAGAKAFVDFFNQYSFINGDDEEEDLAATLEDAVAIVCKTQAGLQRLHRHIQDPNGAATMVSPCIGGRSVSKPSSPEGGLRAAAAEASPAAPSPLETEDAERRWADSARQVAQERQTVEAQWAEIRRQRIQAEELLARAAKEREVAEKLMKEVRTAQGAGNRHSSPMSEDRTTSSSQGALWSENAKVSPSPTGIRTNADGTPSA